MSLPVLTRVELDQERCSACGEDHPGRVLTLVANCHPKAGMRVAYDRDGGVLHFLCAQCQQAVAAILVAEMPSRSLGMLH